MIVEAEIHVWAGSLGRKVRSRLEPHRHRLKLLQEGREGNNHRPRCYLEYSPENAQGFFKGCPLIVRPIKIILLKVN